MRLHSATQINEKRMTKREGVKGRKKCVCMCVSVCMEKRGMRSMRPKNNLSG